MYWKSKHWKYKANLSDMKDGIDSNSIAMVGKVTLSELI